MHDELVGLVGRKVAALLVSELVRRRAEGRSLSHPAVAVALSHRR
jgi:hypothetical protein